MEKLRHASVRLAGNFLQLALGGVNPVYAVDWLDALPIRVLDAQLVHAASNRRGVGFNESGGVSSRADGAGNVHGNEVCERDSSSRFRDR